MALMVRRIDFFINELPCCILWIIILTFQPPNFTTIFKMNKFPSYLDELRID